MDRPARLGKYEVIDILGKGAMGVVYKGFDPRIRRPVALKTIRTDRLNDESEEIHSRFEHEAQAAGRLSHSGIVAVYEYGEDDGVVFIAMEYVEGHNLGEYFAREVRFSLEDTVSILVQLLDALGHAHEQGVIHRDIKPANIILTPSGRIKIADFGIAHIYSSELTQAGMVMGTPCFMAPEQFLAMPADARTDIFSTGVLLFQLLTGQKPFSGSFDKVSYDVCHTPTPLPSAILSGSISVEFDHVVQKAMAKGPDDRYADVHAFRQAILKAFSAAVPATVPGMAQITNSFDSKKPELKAVLASQGAGVHHDKSEHSPPEWDPSILKQIEQQLALVIGPYASIIVKKKAKSESDLQSLCEELAHEMDNEEDSNKFLNSCTLTGRVAGTNKKAEPSAKSKEQTSDLLAHEALAMEVINDAARKLATFLGPIAFILAKKAAAGSSGHRQFYLMLADNIQDTQDREQFLKSCKM